MFLKRIFDHGLDSVLFENDDPQDIAKRLSDSVEHILQKKQTEKSKLIICRGRIQQYSNFHKNLALGPSTV